MHCECIVNVSDKVIAIAMFFQAKQSGCSPGSKSGGGSTESEGPVHVSVNRHDMMLYVHVVYKM